jgi:hypothetical protein
MARCAPPPPPLPVLTSLDLSIVKCTMGTCNLVVFPPLPTQALQAEDARLMGDMAAMRRAYKRLHDVNRWGGQGHSSTRPEPRSACAGWLSTLGIFRHLCTVILGWCGPDTVLLGGALLGGTSRPSEPHPRSTPCDRAAMALSAHPTLAQCGAAKRVSWPISLERDDAARDAARRMWWWGKAWQGWRREEAKTMQHRSNP